MHQSGKTLILPNQGLTERGQPSNPQLQFVGQIVIDLTKEVIDGKSPIIFGHTPACPLTIAYFKFVYEEFIKLNCPENVFNKLNLEIKNKVFKALNVVDVPTRELASVISGVDLEQLTLISEIMTLSNIKTSHFNVFELANIFGRAVKNNDVGDLFLTVSPLSFPELRLLIECEGDIVGAIESRLEKLKDKEITYKVVTKILYNAMCFQNNNFISQNQNPNGPAGNQQLYGTGYVTQPWDNKSF